MLLELFSWLLEEKKPFVLQNKVFSNSLIKSEYQQALTHRRNLIGEVHTARLANKESDASKQLLKHEAYIHFLDHLPKKYDTSFVRLALECLLAKQANYPNTEKKINLLFSELLQEHKDEALDFFQEHEDILTKLTEVPLILLAHKTSLFEAHLTKHLAYQKNSVAVAPFFTLFIEDTERFAASILWLIHRGVSPNQLLETNLLQQYMSYHLAWLDSPESPIHLLYNVLKQFPEAHDLVKIAGTIQCEDRGFFDDKEDKRSYALTGVLCDQHTLRRIKASVEPLEFSSTNDNFSSLYQLFGVSLFPKALMWHAEDHDPEWTAALRHLLNHETIVSTQLEAIINKISAINGGVLLGELSELLMDESINELIKHHSGAVFHFVSLKPSILTQISQLDMKTYLHQLSSDRCDVFDQVSQLVALFKACDIGNKALAVFVYESIIDRVLAHSNLLDDRDLIKKLRKFSEKDYVLRRKYSDLEQKLNDCLSSYSLQHLVTADSYHVIEDTWLNVASHTSSLTKLMPASHTIPSDKYKLQAQWARQIVAEQADFFNLNDFISALELEPILHEDESSEYERLLIELHTNIDNAKLREAIIAKIEIKEGWIVKEYGDSSVFQRAIHKGNLGLIRWLEPRLALTKDSTQKAMLLAADKLQWGIVDYFCATSPYRIPIPDFKHILSSAAGNSQITTVRLLCEKASFPLKEKNIEKAYILAAANGHKEILRYFDQIVPSFNLSAKAFNVAIQSEKLETIEYLGNLPKNMLLLIIAERALVHAATHNNFLMVDQICRLKCNVPRQSVIDEAFLKAAKFGQLSIITYLQNLPGKVPGQKITDKAFIEAVKNEQLDIAQHLCEIKDAPVQTIVFDKLFKTAVIQRDLNSLMSMSELALRLGEASVLHNPCKLNPPKKDRIKAVQKIAASAGYDQVVSYLENVLQYQSQSRRQSQQIKLSLGLKDKECPSVVSEPVSPVSSDDVNGLKQLGLFRHKKTQPKKVKHVHIQSPRASCDANIN